MHLKSCIVNTKIKNLFFFSGFGKNKIKKRIKMRYSIPTKLKSVKNLKKNLTIKLKY